MGTVDPMGVDDFQSIIERGKLAGIGKKRG